MAAHPLDRVFAEHKKPKHCKKEDLHAQLIPVADAVAAVQKQMIEYRASIAKAHLEDDELTHKTEHMSQTVAAAEREAAVVFEGIRQLAKTLTQLDRYMAQCERDIVGEKA